MRGIEQEIERIEREDAWDDADQAVRIGAKQPLDKVVPVRLTSEQWEQLRREAREMGVGPSTLVWNWTLEKLREDALAETRQG